MIELLIQFAWVFILAVAYVTLSSPLLAQTYDIEKGIDLEPIEYRESALRRFEIIFTASIPFTALHSYLTVRTVQMIRLIEADGQDAAFNRGRSAATSPGLSRGVCRWQRRC